MGHDFPRISFMCHYILTSYVRHKSLISVRFYIKNEALLLPLLWIPESLGS